MRATQDGAGHVQQSSVEVGRVDVQPSVSAAAAKCLAVGGERMANIGVRRVALERERSEPPGLRRGQPRRRSVADFAAASSAVRVLTETLCMARGRGRRPFAFTSAPRQGGEPGRRPLETFMNAP